MKKEINRTLGNSLRCILPSFWWKRLLSKMVDKIESAESSASSAMKVAILAGTEASDKQDRLVSGSNIKTINHQSILGSGNIIVDTDKVEKYKTKEDLDANGSLAGGDIAAVVDALLVEKPFTECYQPTRSEIETDPYNKKLTKVDGLVLNSDFNPNLISSNYGHLSVRLYSDGKSKGYHKEYPSYLEIEFGYSRDIICFEYYGTSGTGHTLYDSSGFNAANIDRVNNILREGDFRFSYFEVTYREDVNVNSYTYYYSYNENFPSDATAMIDSFVKMIFAETQNADIYVRSTEWVKLLKEDDVTGGAGAIVSRDLYAVGLKYGQTGGVITELTSEMKDYNKVTKQLFLEGKADVRIVYVRDGIVETFPVWHYFNYYDSFYFVEPFDHVSSSTRLQMEIHRVRVEDDGTATWERYRIAPDKEVIADSYNAVSGKAVKAYVDGKIAEIPVVTVDSELSDTSENPVQNKVITAALNNKVDKVNGKQLSTEDFTSVLKTKLESLRNYDDTSIQNAVNSLTAQINTLVSSDASVAIENFNEIISFLNGIEDSESLDSIIASIEQQIANKQNIITDLTDIRNGAALGKTALQSIPTEYVTDSKLIAKGYATTSQLVKKQDVISDLESIRSGAVLGTTSLQEHQDISHLATKEAVTNLTNNVLDNEEIYAAAVNDLNIRVVNIDSALSTEISNRESLQTEFQIFKTQVTDNEEVWATSLTDINTRIDNNYQYGEDTYTTKESLNTEIQTINTTILDNEEVIAATLTDLNNQIASLNALITDLTNRIETLENA